MAFDGNAMLRGMLYYVYTGQINMGASRNASGYKLNVGEKIMAEEVRVQLQSAWPDDVFADSYQLKCSG